MKTLVVISDTHRNLAPLDKIATVLSECDYIVHLGDMASDAKDLMRAYPEKTYVVAGNNDFSAGRANSCSTSKGGGSYARLSRKDIRCCGQ